MVATAVAVPVGATLEPDSGDDRRSPATTGAALDADPSPLALGSSQAPDDLVDEAAERAAEEAALLAADLPPGEPPVAPSRRADADLVPADGPGTFRAAPDPDPDAPTEGRTTYSVEVEETLPVDERRVARVVAATLDDPRGWRGVLGIELEQVGVDDDPDIRIRVATPGTTDDLCYPLLTRGQVSCRNGELVVLNALRWTVGIPDYAGDLPLYRTYLVNHEVGHALGRGHVACPGPGEPAPVMMQQTYGLGECRRNAWPVAG